MYHPGDLKGPDLRPCRPEDRTNGWCDVHDSFVEDDGSCRHGAPDTDSRGGWMETPPAAIVWLPHSSEYWIIGGVDQIDALIEDLRAWREALRAAEP